MIFNPTPLQGSFVVEIEPKMDERGVFFRAFCAKEFKLMNLETAFVQANISTNVKAGTVRGLHFQRAPHEEVKLVRCIRGAIYDVIVDLRAQSPTYMQWYGAELSEKNGLMMYVPKGFAHGYQALCDDAVVHYMVSSYYAPEFEGGRRFNDPKLSIKWPHPVTAVSDKDYRWPLLTN